MEFCCKKETKDVKNKSSLVTFDSEYGIIRY